MRYLKKLLDKVCIGIGICGITLAILSTSTADYNSEMGVTDSPFIPKTFILAFIMLSVFIFYLIKKRKEYDE